MNLYDKFPNDIRVSALKFPVFGNRINEAGEPEVGIFVPGLQRHLELLKKSNVGSHPEVFEGSILISFLHEFDHLVLGLSGVSADIWKVVDDERQVLARTCEESIKTITEVYGVPLSPPDQDIYDTWLASGRNPESPQWRRRVAGIYKNSRK